jgi:hypothetical protein
MSSGQSGAANRVRAAWAPLMRGSQPMPAKKQDEQAAQDEVATAGAEQLQQQTDTAHEQGFVGQKVDPEPNESYTLQGVTKKANG